MRFGTAALTLAVGLGVAGLVSGEEESSGNWLTRMFTRPEAKAPAEPARKIEPPAPSASTISSRLLKAQSTFNRRVDVCDVLAQIAEQTGDEDLRRKVEQLELRTWDAYQAAASTWRTPDRAITTVSRNAVLGREASVKEGRR